MDKGKKEGVSGSSEVRCKQDLKANTEAGKTTPVLLLYLEFWGVFVFIYNSRYGLVCV